MRSQMACLVFPISRFASPHGNDRCLVIVKQSNDVSSKQAYLRSISQINNVKYVSLTVNTNRPHCLDCLTVDTRGLDLALPRPEVNPWGSRHERTVEKLYFSIIHGRSKLEAAML